MADEVTSLDLRCEISDQPLDVAGLIAHASDESCGAVAAFVGTVRSSPAVAANRGRAVVALDYDVHPELAPARLAEIGEDAASRWEVRKLVAVHRSGSCALGEPTVVVACSAPHRGDALDACRFVIDTIKATVPIWKREVYADGSSWVGTERDAHGV